MATKKCVAIDVAVKANPAQVLPTLLVAKFGEQNHAVTCTTIKYQDIDKLGDKDAVHVTSDGDAVLADENAIQYFIELLRNTPSTTPNGVCCSVAAKTQFTDNNQVYEWIERSKSMRSQDFKVVKTPLDELNNHLLLRSYVVGHTLTIADLVVWGSIRGNRIATNAVRKGNNSLSRWFEFIDKAYPWVAEVYLGLSSEMAKEKVAASKSANYDLGLPQFDAPMVTRFPPEPSGYLHIGHAKAAMLNDYFAHQKKGGTLLLRFDDTNPTKESMEFQESIVEDLKLMEIYPDKTSYSSDYFQVMHDYAIQIIKDGHAFADDSELGKGNDDRRNRIPSKRRDLSIEESLARFEDMKSGSEEGQRWCIRARIDYKNDNGALRDPVIYRVNLIPHHRTGSTWKIYPTYDFCAPILDSIEGVTLALRTNEYRERNAQYEWMQKTLKIREVPIWDFARMNFKWTLLSKRKLTRIVNDGRVWGWDDPRMPTVRGIIRRGETVPALREFIISQGPSRNDVNLDWTTFWAFNKKVLDPIAPRHTAIDADKAVYCDIRGIDAAQVIERPILPKDPSRGSKKVMLDKKIVLEQIDAQSFAKDEEITLMGWGNAIVREIEHEADGKTVSKLTFDLHLEGDFKKTKKKVTWLAAVEENMFPVDLLTFGYLITKEKLEKTDDPLEKFLNPTTVTTATAFTDCNVAAITPGTTVQFERKGFFRLDPLRRTNGTKPVYFDVPTGKF